MQGIWGKKISLGTFSIFLTRILYWFPYVYALCAQLSAKVIQFNKYIFTYSFIQSLIGKLLYDFDNLFWKHFQFIFIDLVRVCVSECDVIWLCAVQNCPYCITRLWLATFSKCSVDVFIVFFSHKRLWRLSFAHPLSLSHVMSCLRSFSLHFVHKFTFRKYVCDVCAPFIFPQISGIAFFIYFSIFFLFFPLRLVFLRQHTDINWFCLDLCGSQF